MGHDALPGLTVKDDLVHVAQNFSMVSRYIRRRVTGRLDVFVIDRGEARGLALGGVHRLGAVNRAFDHGGGLTTGAGQHAVGIGVGLFSRRSRSCWAACTSRKLSITSRGGSARSG